MKWTRQLSIARGICWRNRRQPRKRLRREAIASSPGKHTTIGIPIGSKPGIDATKKLPDEGFKRPWPPLIKMDAAVRKAIDARFGVAKTK